MTREQFIDLHKHELLGLVLDAFAAAKSKGGAELSFWAVLSQSKVTARLGIIYDSFQPKPAPVPVKPQETANGKPEGTGAAVGYPRTAGPQATGGPRQ